VICYVLLWFEVLYVVICTYYQFMFMLNKKFRQPLLGCGLALIAVLFDLARLAVYSTYDTLCLWHHLPTIHLPIHKEVILDRLEELGRVSCYFIVVVGKVFLCHKVCIFC